MDNAKIFNDIMLPPTTEEIRMAEHGEPEIVQLPVDCCPDEGEGAEDPKDLYEGTPMKTEALGWKVRTMVEKFDGDYTAEEIAARGIKPVEVFHERGNLVTNAGIQRIIDQLIGATTAPYNNTNCRLGVGNSSTAASAGQTDLQASAGSSNRQFKMMDSTYPSRSSQTMTFKATFASGEAQFAWNEWCIDKGTADGTTVTAPMLNRKVSSMGTKGAVSWALTVTITPTST